MSFSVIPLSGFHEKSWYLSEKVGFLTITVGFLNYKDDLFSEKVCRRHRFLTYKVQCWFSEKTWVSPLIK